PLNQADGRVLAEPLLAGRDLPPWPNSAMVGYALRHADWQGEALPVSQKVFAGESPQPLQPRTAARMCPGAPGPEGADTVEMQQNVELLADGRVSCREPLKPGQHIRPMGQETRKGDCVLDAGALLGPITIGLAATLGQAELRVRRRPRVAL